MTTRDRHNSRRLIAVIQLAALVMGLLWVHAVPAAAAPGSFTDPDDVALRLDLKTASHADDRSITYTLETYESFPDQHADFLWTLDGNRDGTPDWYVEVLFEEGRLFGAVNDGAENPVADAAVSRPAPNAIQVSFPASALKGATSYVYSVVAQTDVNQNGEPDAGESDTAPDTGSYEHVLGQGAPQSSAAPPPQPAASPAPQPAASPAPQPAASPAPQPAATPAPRPATTPAPQPAAAPAPRPAASSPTPALAPPAVVAGTTAPAPAAAPAAPQATNLASTGFATTAAAAVGALLLALGGLCLATGRRQPGDAQAVGGLPGV
jgi:hypothetical protein